MHPFMQMKKNKCKGSIFHLQTILTKLHTLQNLYNTCLLLLKLLYPNVQPSKKLCSLQLAIQSFSYIKWVKKSLGSIISIKYLNWLYMGELYIHNNRVTVKPQSVWLSMFRSFNKKVFANLNNYMYPCMYKNVLLFIIHFTWILASTTTLLFKRMHVLRYGLNNPLWLRHSHFWVFTNFRQ